MSFGEAFYIGSGLTFGIAAATFMMVCAAAIINWIGDR